MPIPALIGGLVSGGIGLIGSAIAGATKGGQQQVATLTPGQQAAQSQYLQMSQSQAPGAFSLYEELAGRGSAYNELRDPMSSFEQDVENPLMRQRNIDVQEALQGKAATGELSSMGSRALEAGIRGQYAGQVGALRSQTSQQERQNELQSILQRNSLQAQIAQGWGGMAAQFGQLGMGQAFNTVQQQSPTSQFFSGMSASFGAAAAQGLTQGITKAFPSGG